MGAYAHLVMRLTGYAKWDPQLRLEHRLTHGSVTAPQPEGRKNQNRKNGRGPGGKAFPQSSTLQNFQPLWIATIPPERFCHFTRSNPARSIMPARVGWSGNMRMLSARYW